MNVLVIINNDNFAVNVDASIGTDDTTVL